MKSYEDFLQKTKLKGVRTEKRILTPYSSFSQRKNYFDKSNTNKLVEEYSRKSMPLYLRKKVEHLTGNETTSNVPALQLTENTEQDNDLTVNENDDDIFEHCSKASSIHSTPSSLSDTFNSSIMNKDPKNPSMKKVIYLVFN